ncbi:TonB-dependent siderophore receptor [Inquilinus sp. CAU 1745]|uniref:TonB-dependent siderophore receptor n=1 Tax=Inquilinus sp. CAU 1745 TaxID=3140369 RepID=UPI00325C251B
MLPLSSLRSCRLALLATAALFPLSSGALAQEADAGGETMVLDRIEVTGDAESDDILVQDGYVATEGQIGSKTDNNLLRVPQSISVVTEDQLDDRNPRTLLEALNYVPGVRTGAFGFDPRFNAFFVRGFAATYNGVFRDGLREFNGPTSLFRTEPYGLEGITILKGPSSTLYGASSAGGLVNLMTKRPTAAPFREVEVQIGSHDRYQGNFDISGPATESGSVLYRLTGVARDSGTEIEGFPDDRLYFAPALTFRPNDDTTLTLLGEVMDSTVGGTAIYVNDANGVTDLYGGDPEFNDFRQQQQRIGWEFEHRINDVFTVRQKSRFSHVDNDLEYAYVTGISGDTVSRMAGRNAEEVYSFVADNHVQALVDTGPVQHTFLTGFDIGYVTYDQSQQTAFAPVPTGGDTLPLTFTAAQDILQLGIYAQDEMRLGPWALTLGGRHDWLYGDTESPDGSGGRTVEEQDDTQFSWRAGLSYRTDFGLIPYVNYTTSFTPNVGELVDGTPAAPTVGEQKEIGLKYEFPNVNAVATAALFDIEQTDGVVFDASSGVNEQVQLDLQSRGFEFEIATSLDNGLNLIASYSYVNMEILEGVTGAEGNTLSSTPYHTASLYADYTIPSGVAEGLGFGGGVRYVGESYGDDLNTFENDARVLLDGAIHYDLGALSPRLEGAQVQLNVTNLLDERKQVCSAGYCYIDEGRMVIGSLRYRF